MTKIPRYMSPVLVQSVFEALTNRKQSAGEIAHKTGITNPRRFLNYLKREGKAQSKIRTLYRNCELWYISPKPPEVVPSCRNCSARYVKKCLACKVV
jgi:hypothetical protein